ncbi:dehydratase [Leifsonia sp. Root227]|uniref:MaoC family dehydratase n=1 Tax=Leifsonia sp. Root227 TaxID=1736496 RepID=UPI0007013AB9|nr:MaoC family dehydratase N-terminal domain-containing protein [Leifsonia sp. Root227]KRC51976.1 dehydratase [Leifsonia sp. Root227]
MTQDSTTRSWRDLTDPRRIVDLDDIEDREAGRKEPEFENLDIPENLGTVRELIDDHKIKRYAFTQDEYGPWYFDNSPFGGRIGQAALLCNDLVQMFTNVYAASKVVGFHTEEQMWFDSPARLGEEVTLSATYTDSYVRRGEGYVVMDAQVTGEDGRSVIRHRGVEILKTVPGTLGGRGSGTPERRVTGDVPDDAQVVAVFDGNTTVGDVLKPVTKEVTFEQAAVFSRIGEYVINTHNNLQAARDGKLRQPIVQGAQQFGLIAGRLVEAFGPAFFTTGWMQIKFLVPVEVFEPITITAVVTDIVPRDGGGFTAELDVWIRRPDGRLVTVGWASAALPTNS